MSATAIVIDALVAACLVISFVKSREKTWQALKVAYFASKRIAPMLLGIIAAIGLLMASVIGPGTGLLGVLAAALLGSVLMIPGIVAFPLAKSLMVMGASVMSTAAFITTLMMIGFVFIPLEIQLLGKKFCVLRNGLSFIAALIIAVIMGLILG
jgi:uncharacterized membrane protein YraQ (UPF0718 family)